MTVNETRLPAAAVKRNFYRILAAVERGERTVILRDGRPVAALGPIGGVLADLPVARRPGGLLTLLGALADWETMDADMTDVVASRRAARP
jgi:antitoxin (DNA-binding transcriptional repressor) of toxin-antitoxin stability system